MKSSSSTFLFVYLSIAILTFHPEKVKGAFTSNYQLYRRNAKYNGQYPLASANKHSQASASLLFQATESSEEKAVADSEVSTKESSSTNSNLSVATADTSDSSSPLDGIQKDLETRWNIFQESNREGYGFKQSMANVLAGEYDKEGTRAHAEEMIRSAPCVMFTWERSPSCVQAVDAFDVMGISDQIKVIRLDDPWSEGNPIRAEIGKMVGRSSVPMIFIGGKYVGGFDGGVSDESPGIQTMAFRGTLRPTLEAAGISFPET